MCPSLIQIGSKTAEKNSAQTNKRTNKQTDRQTDTTKIMVTWPWTKKYYTPWGVLVGCSSSLLRPWARRWINHLTLWCKGSAMPDLRSPSQSQDTAASWLVPNYTAWR